MRIIAGLVLIVLGLLAWLGQLLSAVAPRRAQAYGLTEDERAVEPVFWADVRGEAKWDALILWTLPLAGFLLLGDSSAWPEWGLVGGGVYTYFGGRGLFARREMVSRGMAVGSESDRRNAVVMLTVWALVGLATVVGALNAL